MISSHASASWSSLLLVSWLCSCCLYIQLVSSQCLDNQKSLLLEFKKNFQITWSDSTTGKFVGWDQKTDCCHWTGIECDNSTGRVIGLDLNMKYIQGRIDNSFSLFRLQFLRSLDLGNNFFSGSIPSSSLVTLNLLEHVDLNNNQFHGPIPSFSSAKKLKYLDLSNNQLNGSITSTDWGKLFNLEFLSLGNNLLDGKIPESLFSHHSLQTLILSLNKFGGQLNGFTSSSKLELLDLSYNNLEGPVPNSIYQLRELSNLYLSSNKFNGTLKLAQLLNGKNIFYHLELSHNLLSVDMDGCGVNSSFPQLYSLSLASCSLRAVPNFLKNQTSLNVLDLSMNQISGTIPGWIWGIPNQSLNLSCNHFVHLEPPLTLPNTSLPYSLDLHSNNLQGHFPAVSSYLNYLDCSENNFTSIDSDIGNYLSPDILFVSFSRNDLQGSIPATLCNATQLQILNLENNHFHGTIPDCLVAMTQLIVLNLAGNALGGVIPDKFPENNNNCNLQTLNLNQNLFQGRIPQSLANCYRLEVLDLGNNQLNDTFPCNVVYSSELQVIVLRSNKFHGTIVCLEENEPYFPQLKIMDLASNHFSGELPAQMFLSLTPAMVGTNVIQPELLDGSHGIASADGTSYYKNSVSITFKGLSYEVENNLAIYISIDFSDNAFHGELPKELGYLNALVVLNLSHNSFSGNIPSSIGNLSQIESLDLSCNAFNGSIPPQLADLNFLSYFNLSFNKLSGKIPTSTQLGTFDKSSYEGNRGLYGPPLTMINRGEPKRGMTTPTSPEGSNWNAKSQKEWMLRGAGVGFPVGIIIFIGPLLYIKKYREWYCKHLHRLVMRILCKEDTPRGKRGRKSRQPRRRS